MCVSVMYVMVRHFYCAKQMKGRAEGQKENTRFFETLLHRLFHLGSVMEQYDAELHRSVEPPSCHP